MRSKHPSTRPRVPGPPMSPRTHRTPTPGPRGSESRLDPAHVDVAPRHRHRVGGHAVSATMIGLAGPDIEGPAMPRAGDDMTVEPAVRERAPAMWADRVDGEDLAAHIEERHGLVAGSHDHHPGPSRPIFGACHLDAERPRVASP